jgi:hypothetical protein
MFESLPSFSYLFWSILKSSGTGSIPTKSRAIHPPREALAIFLPKIFHNSFFLSRVLIRVN